LPEVLILTGPPGAGKTTSAEALAERYDRVAIVPVDALDEFITPTGHVQPWGPPEAWARQRRLDIKNACSLALNFLEARFAVIIDDTVIGEAELSQYVDALSVAGVGVHLVRLMPSLEVCQARNAQRDRHQRMRPDRVEAAYRAIEAAGDLGGATVDTATLSAHETADKLQALTTSGASLLSR
jgi:chloramphenicol 3-O-phosphotransferase